MKRTNKPPTKKSATTGPTELSAALVKKAKAEHEGITADLQDLQKGWGTLARRCLAFSERKYHHAIKDPKTGKPYQEFTDWATAVFGRSRSTLYAHMRIVKKLGDAVNRKTLDRMPKQNAEALVEYQKNGGKIRPRLLEKAEKLPEREFREELGLKRQRAKARPAQSSPPASSPFPASEATKQRFQRALEIAKWLIREDQRELPVEDKALELIVGEFLDAHEAEYAEAHPDRKSAVPAQAPREAAVAASVAA